MKNYLITLAALSLTLMSCNNQKQAKTVTLGPNPFITHMYTADPCLLYTSPSPRD